MENAREFLSYLAVGIIGFFLVIWGVAQYKTPVCPECRDSTRTTRVNIRYAHCRKHGRFPVHIRRRSAV